MINNFLGSFAVKKWHIYGFCLPFFFASTVGSISIQQRNQEHKQSNKWVILLKFLPTLNLKSMCNVFDNAGIFGIVKTIIGGTVSKN